MPSINLKIFNFLWSEVGLSVTTTKDGLFEEALIKPHEPSSKENLIPFTVINSFISWLSILIFSFLILLNYITISYTKVYFSSSLQNGAIVGD